jgi:hypothetical protein
LGGACSIHSFTGLILRKTLLADLATLARNTVTTALNPAHEFVVTTP